MVKRFIAVSVAGKKSRKYYGVFKDLFESYTLVMTDRPQVRFHIRWRQSQNFCYNVRGEGRGVCVTIEFTALYIDSFEVLPQYGCNVSFCIYAFNQMVLQTEMLYNENF